MSPHLDEALGMSEEERSRWMRSLRVRDPSLANDLEVLLDHHRALSREGFLQGRSMELPAGSGLTGQTLGAYTLVSLIGQGGMGSVWLAERNDARFERKVAVKLLNIALIGRTWEERFKREGEILGRLNHPNIAQLFDAGVSPAGQPYLVLEHIHGDHLDSYCDARQLGMEARLRILLDVLEAVAYAHENLVVHRDLKPPNILVRNDGRVKLLDFGIAKLLETDASLTLDGVRAMTPEYAAPEQTAGGTATPATDVWALGVLLHVLLTGQHPVSGLKLRGELGTIAAIALKQDPADRYLSARELADDLHRYLRREPIQARPDSIAYRAGKFLRRHKRSVAGGLLAAVLAGALLLHREPRTVTLQERRLTANPQESPVLNAAISPDGKYLSYADRQGVHLQFVETGETQDLALPRTFVPIPAGWVVGGWYPDSSRFIASVAVPGKPAGLWSVSIRGLQWEKLADLEGLVGRAAISPDGSRIAYGRLRSGHGAREIWLMGSHGEAPHAILTAEDRSSFGPITWSPAGDRIAYLYARQIHDLPTLTVETCDLSGANRATIVRDDALGGLVWLPSGRFLYTRSTQTGTAGAASLWEVTKGKPRRLANWSGSFVYGLSASADGKRLAFLRGPHHSRIVVGDLAAGGNRLADSRRLITDENINIALAWTPDSREVIFSAQRAATRQLYRRSIDPPSTAQLLTPAPDMSFYMARFSPDRAWVFVEGEPMATRQMGVYRMPFTGGVPQLLFPIDGLVMYSCTNRPGGLCALGRFDPASSRLVVSSFNESGLNGQDLLRIPVEPGTSAALGFDYAWQLAPDGSRIALLKKHQNQIRLVPLQRGEESIIDVKSFPDLIDVHWAADSRSLFVSSLEPNGAALLHVGLNGNAHAIWSQPQTTSFWGFPSPDGRHLVISGESPEANAWTIVNF